MIYLLVPDLVLSPEITELGGHGEDQAKIRGVEQGLLSNTEDAEEGTCRLYFTS